MTKVNANLHPMHPNSLANLNRKGRAKAFDSEKKKRFLTVTEEGWSGVLKAAETVGCSSVSDLLERLGRGNVVLSISVENHNGDRSGEYEPDRNHTPGAAR